MVRTGASGLESRCEAGLTTPSLAVAGAVIGHWHLIRGGQRARWLMGTAGRGTDPSTGPLLILLAAWITARIHQDPRDTPLVLAEDALGAQRCAPSARGPVWRPAISFRPAILASPAPVWLTRTRRAAPFTRVWPILAGRQAGLPVRQRALNPACLGEPPGAQSSVSHESEEFVCGAGHFQPPPFEKAVIIGEGKPVREIWPLQRGVAARPGSVHRVGNDHDRAGSVGQRKCQEQVLPGTHGLDLNQDPIVGNAQTPGVSSHGLSLRHLRAPRTASREYQHPFCRGRQRAHGYLRPPLLHRMQTPMTS
jgi:hypothetical protein